MPILNTPRGEVLLLLLKYVVVPISLALFIYFLGFRAIIILYFLLLFQTCRKKRTGTTSIYPDATTDTASGTTPECQNSLLDVTYVAASPIRQMKDCVICLESFEEGEKCRTMTKCRHLFHADCVDRWLEGNLTCPICRKRVFLYPGLSNCASISFDDRWKMFYVTVFEGGEFY